MIIHFTCGPSEMFFGYLGIRLGYSISMTQWIFVRQLRVIQVANIREHGSESMRPQNLRCLWVSLLDLGRKWIFRRRPLLSLSRPLRKNILVWSGLIYLLVLQCEYEH